MILQSQNRNDLPLVDCVACHVSVAHSCDGGQNVVEGDQVEHTVVLVLELVAHHPRIRREPIELS